jgi:hypothetical protein
MCVASRRFSLWQKTVALAPALLLLVYLPGEMMLRCRADGMLRAACCCPQTDEPQQSGPVLKAQDCCDRVVAHNVQRPVVEPARGAGHDLVWAAASVAPGPLPAALDPPPSLVFDRASQTRGSPHEGPPLVLLKHAFLI